MAQCLLRKLKSARGASLSLALLLFLVCTIITAIVIVAGTTVSGRFANLAKSDQRYYDVISAMDLFEDLLNSNNDYIIVRESIQYTESFESNKYQYTVDQENCNTEVLRNNVSTINDFNSGISNATDLDLVSLLGDYFAYGTNAATSGAAKPKTWGTTYLFDDENEWYDVLSEWEQTPTISASAITYPLTLSFPFDVSVKVTIKPDGSAIVDFKNDVGETTDITYVAHANMVLSEEVSNELSSSVPGTYEETKTTTFKWEITDIWTEKVTVS